MRVPNISSGENEQHSPAPSGSYGRPIPKGAEFAAGALVGGSYEIVDYLGRGAMGFVYRARHNILGREYALKTLGADQVSDTSWRRFQIEAQAIAKMSHPNVVGIHNFALHHSEGLADIPFYVMDLLEGRNLSERLRDDGTPPLAIVLAIFQQAAAGLGYAHSKGMIHRDVKPGNIVLLNKPDAVGATVKIVDFGIAKLTDAQYGAQKLTTAGEVFGSPLYMSPEQSMAQTLDQRTDIYSLGVTLFESLTGEPPFIADSAVEVMMMHQGAPIPIINDVSEVGYPAEVQQIVEKMMAKMPDDRYQSMDHVVADLVAVARGQEPALGAPRLSDTGKLEPRYAGGDVAGAEQADRVDSVNRVGGEANSGPLFSPTKSFTQGPHLAQVSDDEPEEKTARTIKVLSISLAALAVIASIFMFFVYRPTDLDAKRASVSRSSDGGTKVTSEKLASGAPTDTDAQATSSSAKDVNEDPAAGFLGLDSKDGEVLTSKVFKKGGTDHSYMEDQFRKSDASNDATNAKKFKVFGGVQKPPRGSEKETFKYSTLVEVDGVKMRRFQFPTDITIGTFDAKSEDMVIEARGPIDMKANVEYTFMPDLVVEKYPQYMKRFRFGDVTTVNLAPFIGRDKVLEAVSFIPGVTRLVIEKNSDFTASSLVSSLRRFKSLLVFHANATGTSTIDGAGLAEANCWQKLESLVLIKVSGLQPLLKILKNSPGLKGLTVQKAGLTSRDIEIISTLSSLQGLDISQNIITANDLNTLSKLPQLEYLNLQECGLEIKALLVLKKFKHLRKVDAFPVNAPQEFRDALSKELPLVSVH